MDVKTADLNHRAEALPYVGLLLVLSQVGAAAAAAEAEAVAAHNQQKKHLQQRIAVLQLELQQTAEAKQEQEALVSCRADSSTRPNED